MVKLWRQWTLWNHPMNLSIPGKPLRNSRWNYCGGACPIQLSDFTFSIVSYKVNIANSIWFRDSDSLTINEGFLKATECIWRNRASITWRFRSLPMKRESFPGHWKSYVKGEGRGGVGRTSDCSAGRRKGYLCSQILYRQRNARGFCDRRPGPVRPFGDRGNTIRPWNTANPCASIRSAPAILQEDCPPLKKKAWGHL